MVTTHGATTHWFSTNRFLPLANMPTEPAAPRTTLPKKRKSAPRRKRYSRAAKRLVDPDDLNLSTYTDAWQELPESYVPQLGVVLDEGVTLNSLPRESPPVLVRVDKRRRERERVDMDDWDMVSTCSEESFCMV